LHSNLKIQSIFRLLDLSKSDGYLQHKILHFLNGYITVLNNPITKLIIFNTNFLFSHFETTNIINKYSIILATSSLLTSILKLI